MTGWGTIALAVVTFLTVFVAIRTTKTDRRRDDKKREDDRREADNRIRAERYSRQLAQARLVITPETFTAARIEKNVYGIQFPIVNHSDRPIIGVEAEVWPRGMPLAAYWALRETNRYLLAGDSLTLEIKVDSSTPAVELGAWRITWTDADGSAWCVDQPGQSEPRPYEGGPPRPC